jgi:hypothetical protein
MAMKTHLCQLIESCQCFLFVIPAFAGMANKTCGYIKVDARA